MRKSPSTRTRTCPPSAAITRISRETCCRFPSTARRSCSTSTRTRSRKRDSRRKHPKRRKNSKLDWSINFLPYYDDVKGAPQNSIIGGASLWVLGGKKPDEYKGVAKFFAFLSRPEIQMDWHLNTGYVPITLAAYELTRKSGFYDKNPGDDMPVKELTNKAPTATSKGLRSGTFLQGRELIEEELESVFAGRKDAKSALDDAVKRGNEVLRKFEAAAGR